MITGTKLSKVIVNMSKYDDRHFNPQVMRHCILVYGIRPHGIQNISDDSELHKVFVTAAYFEETSYAKALMDLCEGSDGGPPTEPFRKLYELITGEAWEAEDNKS